MKTLTIEQLAEKLQGNLWIKGDLKRIYLDRGYNTKKMTTKTYVYERDGQFMVSCNVECANQPWQWCKSQEDEVKESVLRDIEEIKDLLNLELIEAKLTEDKTEVEVLVSYNGEKAIWMNESTFYSRYNNYPESVFEGLPETLQKEAKSVDLSNYLMPLNFGSTSMPPKTKKTENPIFGEGKTVNHSLFGNGVVLVEGDEKIEIEFEGVGFKKLLKKFCSLTLVG